MLKLVIDIFMKLITEGLLRIPISHSQVSFVKYSHSYFVENYVFFNLKTKLTLHIVYFLSSNVYVVEFIYN